MNLSLRFPGLAPWLLALAGSALAATDLIKPFPLDLYDRLTHPWLTPQTETRLFSPAFQDRQALAFQRKFLGPWEPAFVAREVTPEVLSLEARVFTNLQQDIEARRGFGPSHRPYGLGWLQRLRNQVRDPGPFVFKAAGRAVALENAPVRLLPTADLYLQSHTLPGLGYPFDNLQNAVVWAGTPVYVLQESRDRAWCKVVAPGLAGWVRAQSLALAGDGFVAQWRRAVARHGLAAAIQTETPVLDRAGQFRFHAYVGSVFPQWASRDRRRAILIPGRHGASRQAVSEQAFLPEGTGVRQPWAYTAHNAAALWQTLLGRPYGWGNLNFHNDCSAEMKCFFTPFGLWLPRHSADQREVGPTRDLSGLGLPERMAALRELARPYRTLVWIEGHVMLYLGPLDYLDGAGTPATGFMSYQNLWGLRPRNPPDYRAIVGGSVLFPVLDFHPEGPELDSLANKKRLVLTYLDGTPPDPPASPGPAARPGTAPPLP